MGLLASAAPLAEVELHNGTKTHKPAVAYCRKHFPDPYLHCRQSEVIIAHNFIQT